MTGPHPAVAATRVAVRRCVRQADRSLVVAVSGGADSLALASAVAFEVDPARPSRLPVDALAVAVDHRLQPGSAEVAARAAAQCRELGLPARVVTVDIPRTGAGGPEARARTARYEALESVRAEIGADAVLLGHTRDDQAEQVLLGLARGSGARSLSGMPAERGPLRRPFLEIDHVTTRAACVALGIDVWDDPHNTDPRYLRVRARELLTRVEQEVPGVRAALARSADLLRDDADALDAIADDLAADLGGSPWPVEALATRPAAVRRRVWRALTLRAGVPAGSLRAGHLTALDALAVEWHGQGPVDLPGGLQARRLSSPARIHLVAAPDAAGRPQVG